MVTAGSADAWERADELLERMDPPEFPDREFDITEYGAVGDSDHDCTDAFERAILACTEAGGGRVVVPDGTYRTGAIHLADDVELHLKSDATVRFAREPERYLPVVHTRYEGIEVRNYSPFIYVADRSNVAITGTGTLDGRADEDHWWDWSGGDHPNEYDAKDELADMVDAGVPVDERVFGDGHHLRPNLVQFYECENVLVEGVTMVDSPMWHLHPVLCRNVTVRNVTIDTPRGSNTDGCNPESCRDVHIDGCSFNTGDDCLSFKAGKGADGRQVDQPCENALVENCEMSDGNGGVVVGSETTGGIRNIFARDCRMSSPNLKRALRIKSNAERGGYVRGIYFEDIDVGRARNAAVEIALDYANVRTGPHKPLVTDIDIRGLHVKESSRALRLVGVEDNPIGNLRLSECIFESIDRADRRENVERIVMENVHI